MYHSLPEDNTPLPFIPPTPSGRECFNNNRCALIRIHMHACFYSCECTYIYSILCQLLLQQQLIQKQQLQQQIQTQQQQQQPQSTQASKVQALSTQQQAQPAQAAAQAQEQQQQQQARVRTEPLVTGSHVTGKSPPQTTPTAESIWGSAKEKGRNM